MRSFSLKRKPIIKAEVLLSSHFVFNLDMIPKPECNVNMLSEALFQTARSWKEKKIQKGHH